MARGVNIGRITTPHALANGDIMVAAWANAVASSLQHLAPQMRIGAEPGMALISNDAQTGYRLGHMTLPDVTFNASQWGNYTVPNRPARRGGQWLQLGGRPSQLQYANGDILGDAFILEEPNSTDAELRDSAKAAGWHLEVINNGGIVGIRGPRVWFDSAHRFSSIMLRATFMVSASFTTYEFGAGYQLSQVLGNATVTHVDSFGAGIESGTHSLWSYRNGTSINSLATSANNNLLAIDIGIHRVAFGNIRGTVAVNGSLVTDTGSLSTTGTHHPYIWMRNTSTANKSVFIHGLEMWGRKDYGQV